MPPVSPCGNRLTPFLDSTTAGPTPPRASSATALRGSISSLRIRSPHREPAPPPVPRQYARRAACVAHAPPLPQHQQRILIRELSVNSKRPDQDRPPPDKLPPEVPALQSPSIHIPIHNSLSEERYG